MRHEETFGRPLKKDQRLAILEEIVRTENSRDLAVSWLLVKETSSAIARLLS